MPLYNELPSDINEVDVVIAGGGTAGCVVASRLSDADPSLSILVLESGADGTNDPKIKYPALFFTVLDPASPFMTSIEAKPSEQVLGRNVAFPYGRVLGGGSSVNMMTYSRSYHYDFESWDMPGWSYDELLPYFKKFENYLGPGKDDVHGKGGPITVSSGTMVQHKTQDDFISAATKVGFPEQVDVQDFHTAVGTQRSLQYISPSGERQDTATKYLLPRLADGKHPSLHVALHTHTEKVLFDESKRAVGVVVCTSSSTTDGAEPQYREIRAKRQVIVCSGTLGSPQILQRSGVGSANVLERAGVPLVADNPNVGQHFSDHLLIMNAYRSSSTPEEAFDRVISGEVDLDVAFENKDPVVSWTAMDTICQVRPKDAQVAALGPEFKAKFDKYWGGEPTKIMGIHTALNAFPGPRPPELLGEQYFGTTTFATYPFARGHVHITGPKSSDPVDMRTGFLQDEGDFDLKAMRLLYKNQREIVRRMDLYRGELPMLHPAFPDGSAAGIHTGALTGEIRDLEYSAEDDAAIDEWIRQMVAGTWHGMGTCQMGKPEARGAVDAKLDVYGVSGLKVADLSVVDGNVAGNTNSTALMIGEKTADILIQELGLSS